MIKHSKKTMSIAKVALLLLLCASGILLSSFRNLEYSIGWQAFTIISFSLLTYVNGKRKQFYAMAFSVSMVLVMLVQIFIY